MKTVSMVLVAGMVGCAFVQPVSAQNVATFQEKVLYSFCNERNCKDGAGPRAGVIDVNGLLYGTTFGGGRGVACFTPACGTAFSLDPNTGTEKVLRSFCRQLNCPDGAEPWFDMTYAKGMLYGITAFGGNLDCSGLGCGTVFSLDPATGAVTTLYAFAGVTDGSTPQGDMTFGRGMIYGTTQGGGTGALGVAFALDPISGAEKVLHSFSGGAGGQNPVGVIYLKGLLYGATAAAGGDGAGAVFSLDPNTGVETVLHSFGNGFDGRYPEAGPIAVNGMLYGTTSGGGHAGCGNNFGCGTVYSIDANTGAETVLYAFCGQQNCTDGANPHASMIEVNGTLYGTTRAGGGTGCGGAGCGTVFSIDPNTGAETVLYSFQGGTDGANPEAGLVEVNGTFFGTTAAGGNGQGTVFALTKHN